MALTENCINRYKCSLFLKKKHNNMKDVNKTDFQIISQIKKKKDRKNKIVDSNKNARNLF